MIRLFIIYFLVSKLLIKIIPTFINATVYLLMHFQDITCAGIIYSTNFVDKQHKYIHKYIREVTA